MPGSFVHDPNMRKVIEYLLESLKQGKKMREEGGPTKWCNFDTLGFKFFDFNSPRTVLNRDKANEAYVKAWDDVESIEKDVIIPKLQVDYLAALERDLRMRNRSRIRLIVHQTAADELGYGHAGGPIQTSTIGLIDRLAGDGNTVDSGEGDEG